MRSVILASLLLTGCCLTDEGCLNLLRVTGIDASFDEAEVCLQGECSERFAPGGSAMIGDSFLASFWSTGAGDEPATLAVESFYEGMFQPGDRLEVRLFDSGALTAEREFVFDSIGEHRVNGDLCGGPVCQSGSSVW